MRKFIWTLVLMLCLVGQQALAADFSKLVILHTNDTHGFDMHGNGHIGMDGISAYKKDLEAQGYDVILLDAGDCIQDNNLVNFSKGKSAIEFMNYAGYTAGCLGNHEFDYGQDVLMERISEAKHHIVSCNIYVDATGEPFVPPSVILDRPSGKIGIVGFTTPETLVSTAPANVYGLTFKAQEELYKVAQAEVDKLKAAGCELIVGVGHMGSEQGCMGNRSDDVIMNVKGLDVFVDGHDHRIKNNYINGVLQVETGSYTKNIGKVTYNGTKWVGELIPFGTYDKQDADVTAVINKYAAEVQAHLDVKLGENVQFLDGAREPGVRTHEMPIGDFLADAYLWQANQANVLSRKVDAAIVNGGSIRHSIFQGVIRRADIVSCAPFNNQLFVATLTGAKLLEIMESATAYLPDAMGGLPQVAGIEYEVNTAVPYAKGPQYPHSLFFAPAKPGSRVTIKTVGGKPFAVNAQYTIVATDFIFTGGDNYAALAMPGAKENYQSIGYVDAEAIENYIVTACGGKIGPEYAQAQGRFVIKK